MAEEGGKTGGGEENEDQGVLELVDEQGHGRDHPGRLQFVRAEEGQPPGGLAAAEAARRTGQALAESVDGQGMGGFQVRFGHG